MMMLMILLLIKKHNPSEIYLMKIILFLLKEINCAVAVAVSI